VIYSSFRGIDVGSFLCQIPLRLTYCLGVQKGSSNPRRSMNVEEAPPPSLEGVTSLEPPRHHRGQSRRLASKVRREPPSLPSLAVYATPSPSVAGLVAI